MSEIPITGLLAVSAFDELMEREGQYVDRIKAMTNGLTPEHMELFFDMLDLKWLALVEQLGIARGLSEDASFAGELDVAMARLQLNSNLRMEFKLPPRNMRNTLMKIPAGNLLSVIEKCSLLDHN